MPTTWRLMVALVTLLIGVTGCGLTHVHDLSFRVDNRLHFVSPADRAEVHRPVTIRWTMSDFRIARPGSEPPSQDAGYFVVFVDRSPIKPGQSLDSVTDDDQACQSNPRCPSRHDLAQYGVYPTPRTSLTVKQVSDLSNDESLQLHSFVVVLVDTSGRRIGESAWELDLRLRKAGV